MKFQGTLKKRKRNRRIGLVAGIILLVGCVIMLWNFLDVRSEIRIAAKNSYLPSKKSVTAEFTAKQPKTNDKEMRKTFKKLYQALKHTKYVGNETVNLYDYSFASWYSDKIQDSPWEYDGETDFYADGMAHNDYNEANLYRLIQTKNGDYQEDFHTLSTYKKNKIKGYDWKQKRDLIYAVDKDNHYIDGTAQMNLAQSEFIQNLEKEGFHGIAEWMKKVEADSKGIEVVVNNKKTLFHDVNKYYRFESNGIEFLYNYADFIIRHDCDSQQSFSKMKKQVPQEGREYWTLTNYNPGGEYTQIQMQSNAWKDTYYESRFVKILKKDGHISQMTLWIPYVQFYEGGLNINQGFYNREKPFIKACLMQMGVKEQEANEWVNHFTIADKKTKGTIGNRNYQKQDLKELTWASKVCKVMIK
ncbi:MAG: hypothetical protein PHD70_07815 [Anaerostipes sp.]|nr:hypothetical protein [Anaerostipes sp.]